MSFSYYEIGSYWRPHELNAAKKHFGEIEINLPSTDLLICRNNTESVSSSALKQALNLEKNFKENNEKGIILNASEFYDYSNSKEKCFQLWEENGVPHPNCKIIENRSDLEGMEFPYLLRLNDGVTGEDTYLIETDKDLQENYPKIERSFKDKGRINTKMICVKFVDTSTEDGFNLSYRIITAGNSVVCGYARISDDWLAITKQFTENKKEAFVRENKRLEMILSKNEEMIVKAMKTTGHNHVGIDAIPDKEGNLYFLEIQPFYFCGNTSRTTPPFWNPYKPKELVDWLIKDEKNLRSELPIYYERWLDKENHFDFCYRSLRESLIDAWPK